MAFQIEGSRFWLHVNALPENNFCATELLLF